MPNRNVEQLPAIYDWKVWVTPIILTIILMVCLSYSYLLFHTLAELFSVIVGVLMFVVAVFSYKYAQDNFVTYLGIGYFWIAAMDLIHTLLYKGMAIAEVEVVQHATQFWIANRYFEAFLLLSAPIFCGRWLGNTSKFIVFGAIATVCYLLIISGIFPDAYIEGEGLTDFKIYSEYIICLILGLALYNLYRYQDKLKSAIFPFLAMSIVLTIFAELAFTSYISLYGPTNILGHIFKLFSFWLILYSIVRISLQAPYIALEKSTNLLKGLRDNIPDLIFYKDNEGIYFGCNQAFCDLIGKKNESEVIGRSDYDLFGSDMADLFRSKDHEMFESGFTTHSDEWVTNADGTKRLMDTVKTPFLNNNGLVIGLIGISRDITERKAIELNLQKVSMAVEQAGEAVLMTGKTGHIEYVNNAFLNLTGYSSAEMLGQHISVLQTDKQKQSFYEELWATINRGETWQDRLINAKNDGSFYPALLTVSPMFDSNHTICNFIAIQQDLTAYEGLAEQFYQSQKMEAVGTLIGGIAHDFNNTLAGITGNLYLAKMSASNLPEVVSRLSDIEKLAFQAAAMIRQLLTFSRKGTLQMNPISITPFLKEVIKLQEVTVPENIKLTYDIDNIIPTLNGDINLLQQALINLINNARDALEHATAPKISIQLKQQQADSAFKNKYPQIKADDIACITISDNGQGIKPKDIEHIFEPFFTTKPEGKGTGLGLSMVFDAVRSHGGEIGVESHLGQGTTFTIYLPLGKKAVVSPLPSNEQTIIHGKGETILLADDDPAVLTALGSVLQSLGYRVLAAKDGVEAVNVYTAHQADIDLLILDVVMPNLGGVEALARIRALSPDVKVIFATGYDKSNDLSDKVHHKQEMFVRKPYAVSELSKMIRDKLDS
ncbi:MAG: hybrid sensor histidine kinase/response regulator [Zetaproteobacteria bacterium CG2_30_46_52]|nr:MAG: hybrid sensor histidine kinase/response regulator [Zetaproteobacteria bacterium CG2_30_46_52]